MYVRTVASYVRRGIVIEVAIVSLLAFFLLILTPAGVEPKIFWDEDYHVVSAQKYLNKVFQMEIHPPLGKLLIALGEYLFDYNQDDAQFIDREQTRETPADFSLSGYRFFPRVLTFLSVPLLLFLLNLVTANRFVSLIGTLSYVLDNALLVHGRGALLEGMQLFFFLLTLCAAVLVHRKTLSGSAQSVFLAGVVGGGFAATCLVKVTGLVLTPVVVCVIFNLLKAGKGGRACLSLTGTFLIIFFIVWQTHFSLGRTVNPALPNQGYYGASPITQELLRGGFSAHIVHFPRMLREYLAFSMAFNQNTERLNLCKPEESGSTPYLWPIGARSIHYQWEHHEGTTSYWMLQVNPVVWALGIVGLLLGGSCVIGALLFGFSIRREKLQHMGILIFMWALYMATMLSISRVMYLYHYFIPLVISLVLGAIALTEIRVSFSPAWQKIVGGAIAGGYVVMLVISFLFFSPLTYGIPLTEQEFHARGLLPVWDLRVYTGELSNFIARPLCDPRRKQ